MPRKVPGPTGLRAVGIILAILLVAVIVGLLTWFNEVPGVGRAPIAPPATVSR